MKSKLCEGFTRKVEPSDLLPGNVIRKMSARIPNGSGGEDIVGAFSDHVIVDVFYLNDCSNELLVSDRERVTTQKNEDGTRQYLIDGRFVAKMVKLARPYCLANKNGAALVGKEETEVDSEVMLNPDGWRYFKTVLGANGKPINRIVR